MNSIVSEKNYISNALGVAYDSLSQGYLRAETALSSQSVIDFTLQENKKNSPIVTERLLSLNDEFVITHFTVALKQVAADAPTNAQHLVAPLYTWENPITFAGTNAANVGTIYNGDLSWTIDRKEFVPQFPMRAFRRVPQTQDGVGSTVVATGDSFENGLFGFYPSEPTKIDGRQTLDLSINLGANIDFDDASNSVYAVFEARGYLIVNAKS